MNDITIVNKDKDWKTKKVQSEIVQALETIQLRIRVDERVSYLKLKLHPIRDELNYSYDMEGNEPTDEVDLQATILRLQREIQEKEELVTSQKQEMEIQRRMLNYHQMEEKNDEASSMKNERTSDEVKDMMNELWERIEQLENGRITNEGEEMARSKRHRSLVAGMNKSDVAKRFPKNQRNDDIEAIEMNIGKYLVQENEHRNKNPKAGEGYHYLKGRTPFWREPWPNRWAVVKPWEFEMHHDHRELQQQLKNLNLDVFNGDKESYRQWQSMFYKTIHVMDLDVDIKYNWLMKHVSEEIKKELIRGISHSASKYCFCCV